MFVVGSYFLIAEGPFAIAGTRRKLFYTIMENIESARLSTGLPDLSCLEYGHNGKAEIAENGFLT